MNMAASPGSLTGSSDTAVSGALTGLTPGTTYHYRLNAASVGGTSHGDDAQFPTTVTMTVPAMPWWGSPVLFALTFPVGTRYLRWAR